MKFLIDFFPVVIFFAVYQFYGIYNATYALVIATLIQAIWFRLQYKRYEKMQIIALITLIIFGGLTILFRAPEFVMWKVTIVNALFAGLLIGSLYIGDKPIMERMLSKQLVLPKVAWRGLTIIWSAMFIVIGIANIYYAQIALNLRDDLIASYPEIGSDVDLQAISCTNALCESAKHAESVWVDFKLFGSLIITLICFIVTGLYIYYHYRQMFKASNQPPR